MPPTFTVFSLGVLPFIDPIEGNNNAEGANLLLNLTFGSQGNALLNQAVTLTPLSFAGGNATAYDMDNLVSNDTFSINGGPPQIFDGVAAYGATITYINGTTANITAVIFQDTAGNTYWAPQITANPSQVAMEALPIRSLTLNSIVQNTGVSGLAAERESWNFLPCFAQGTTIRVPGGEVAIETLAAGDLVQTADHGAQPIRWIGASTVVGEGICAPVRIAPGALGEGYPARPLVVTRQHRVLIRSRIGERQFGAREILVPAIGLVGLPGITLDPCPDEITYLHLLFDRHEIVFADGAPTESLYPGPMARQALGSDAVAEIEAIFPGLLDREMPKAGPFLVGRRLRNLLSRHLRHSRPLLGPA